MGTGVLQGRVVGLVEERLKQIQAPVNLRLWDGQLIRAPQPAPVTLTVNSPQVLTQLASPSLGRLAKSYVEGDIDLEGLVRALDAIGCRAPLGVEVFSDAFDALESVEVGRRLGRAIRALLARARA